MFSKKYTYYLNACFSVFLKICKVFQNHTPCKVEISNKCWISYTLNGLFIHYEEQVKELVIFNFKEQKNPRTSKI